MGSRLFVLALLAAAGCDSANVSAPAGAIPAWECIELPAASPDVTGTYRFAGTGSPHLMRGTITFEQTGDVVRVLDTTYDNSRDRALEGLGVIVGNRLDIVLVPRNGDTDYEAEVTFLFSPDGGSFCCSYADTNLDAGGMGSYGGTRR